MAKIEISDAKIYIAERNGDYTTLVAMLSRYRLNKEELDNGCGKVY